MGKIVPGGGDARRVAGLAAASMIQIGALALLGFLLAKILSIEEYGITRTVSAYFLVFVMLGHFCVHDAAASFIARAENSIERAAIFNAASGMVAVFSILVVIVVEIIVYQKVVWAHPIANVVAITTPMLPLVTITVLFQSVLQATGQVRALIIMIAMTGLVQLVVVAYWSYSNGLTGWVEGRYVSQFLLLIASVAILRHALRKIRPEWKTVWRMFLFARLQFVSGVMSMALQAADVIVLERSGTRFAEIGAYGLAALVTRSIAVMPSAFGRVYFRRIASIAESNSPVDRPDYRLLWITGVACVPLAAMTYFAAPIAIQVFFGSDYLESGPIIKILCLGIVPAGLWNALSVINVARQKPENAVAISAIGLGVTVCLLLILIPVYSTRGAAWAMNIGSLCGVFVGVTLLIKNREVRGINK